MQLTNEESTLDQVKQYYGQTLKTNDDLKTGACCTSDSLPLNVRSVLPMIDNEITEKFYGCGSPIPAELDGCTVLDLGCGSGRDVYLASKLVGPKGCVIGVDMTEEQLEVARRHVDAQTNKFGYDKPNVDFRHGYIEDLKAIRIADNSVDVVMSNCVINLSPDKRRVFSEIFRVLKPGGELFFSDVFARRRIPEKLRTDPVLLGECLGGAMYIEDFRRLLTELGCPDFRTTTRRPFSLDDPSVEAKVGMIGFDSITVRAFKLDSLEDVCEDYGQVVTYLGTLAESPHTFTLDHHHTFSAHRPERVCGNTAAMLSETRYAKHFTVTGDRSTHFGLFDCAHHAASETNKSNAEGEACC